MGYSYNIQKPVNSHIINKYRFFKTEIEDFKSFYFTKENETTNEKNFLNVAIRRFSQASERKNIEDEIIDLMISAEAIFLGSDSSNSGELKYRLSHRAAMFIEEEPNLQKYIFKFMKKAYDIRSKIIHGAETQFPIKIYDNSFNNLYDFTCEIEKYIRIAVKKSITINKIVNKKGKLIGINWEEIVFPPKI